MKIKVKYFNIIRDVTGTDSDEAEFNQQVTLLDVIESLSQKYGNKFKNIFLTGDILISPQIRIFINDELVAVDPGRKLKDGDELLFFVATIGG